jgi:hypothetical protein
VTGKKVGLFSRDVPVAGISFPDALENSTAFIAGCDRFLLLERDPGNRHDPNAIRVIGRWHGASGSEHQMQIGWVPREVAARIAFEAEVPPFTACSRRCSNLSKEETPESGLGFGCRYGRINA